MVQAQIRCNREMWCAGSNVNGPSEIPCLASRLGNKSPIEVQLAGSGHDKCCWDRGSGCCGALGREKRGQWNDRPNPSLNEGVAQGGSGGHPIIITISKSPRVRRSSVRGGGGLLTPTSVPATLHLLWMVMAWKKAPIISAPGHRDHDRERGERQIAVCSLNRPITLTPPEERPSPPTLSLFQLPFTWRQTHTHTNPVGLPGDSGPQAGRIWNVVYTGKNKSQIWETEFRILTQTTASQTQSQPFEPPCSLSYQSRPAPCGGPHINTHENIKRPLW